MYIASSFLKEPLQQVSTSKNLHNLVRWARLWFVPKALYETCHLEMVVIVPYVVHEHSSLFVFGRQCAWHLDSTPDHQDEEEDTFALQVIMAWEASLSRDVALLHEVLRLPVYQQKENYECGRLILNNIRTVCKYLAVGVDELDEAAFLEEIGKPVEPTTIQSKIMQSMAKELVVKTEEEHGYEPPTHCITQDLSQQCQLLRNAPNNH